MNNATANATGTGPVKILAFGDSLVAGWGLEADQAFPSVLERKLRQAGHDVKMINAGVSGDTTADGLARLEWALAEKPDAAILELGANDGLRGMPPEQMEQNLEAMLQTFRERGIPVLLTGIRALANFGPDYKERFEAVFERLAQKYDTLFYPRLLEGVAGKPELNQPDGIHPNAAGAREIAERILPKVVELVERARARD